MSKEKPKAADPLIPTPNTPKIVAWFEDLWNYSVAVYHKIFG